MLIKREKKTGKRYIKKKNAYFIATILKFISICQVIKPSFVSTSSTGLPKWRQSPIDLCRTFTWTKKLPPLYMTNYWSDMGTVKMTNTGRTGKFLDFNKRILKILCVFFALIRKLFFFFLSLSRHRNFRQIPTFSAWWSIEGRVSIYERAIPLGRWELVRRGALYKRYLVRTFASLCKKKPRANPNIIRLLAISRHPGTRWRHRWCIGTLVTDR